jgi:3-hydroxybutyryl-CoA dehydratase
VKLYKYIDLKIGQIEKFTKETTSTDLKKFIKLSGDNSLIHSNYNFAKKNGFKDKVFHGAYIASLFSRLIGTQLPGKYGLLLFIEMKFSKPLYKNQRVFVSGKIIKKHNNLRCIDIVLNAKSENSLIAHGSATVKLFL